jgi:hypothetical protein
LALFAAGTSHWPQHLIRSLPALSLHQQFSAGDDLATSGAFRNGMGRSVRTTGATSVNMTYQVLLG